MELVSLCVLKHKGDACDCRPTALVSLDFLLGLTQIYIYKDSW